MTTMLLAGGRNAHPEPGLTNILRIGRVLHVASPDTLAKALATAAIYGPDNSFTITIAKAGTYAGDLSFPTGVSIRIVGAVRGVVVSGAHTWAVDNSGAVLEFEDVDASGSTLEVSDSGTAASSSPAVVRFVRAQSCPVSMADFATSIVNVQATGDNVANVGGVGQYVLRAVSVLGLLTARNVLIGTGSALSYSVSTLSAEGCVFHDQVALTLSATGGTMRNCRFGGSFSLTYSGSAGTMVVDDQTLDSWLIGAGHDVTNGNLLHRLRGKVGAALADADVTIQVGDGVIRCVHPSTMTDDRDITLGTSGATPNETISVYRFDTTAGHDLEIIDGGPGGTTLATVTPGRSLNVFKYDGTNWAPFYAQRLL